MEVKLDVTPVSVEGREVTIVVTPPPPMLVKLEETPVDSTGMDVNEEET